MPNMVFSRRSLLLSAALLPFYTRVVLAQGRVIDDPQIPAEDVRNAFDWKHSTALTGEPKYPADFDHFDYVNPDAPTGGAARLASQGAFDSFNPVPPRGEVSDGLGLMFETLMTSSLDELNISAAYGLIAEAIREPDDHSWVSFRLNPKARWHDGQPVTAEDVVWSFQQFTTISPQMQFYYRNVVKAEQTGDNEVTFAFDVAGNRELPHIMGQLLVLPKHWWEGKDTAGRQRDVSRGTLEPPLGSGPYRIASSDAGRSLTYERVEDYWGADLPVNVGQNNFDFVRWEYFRDLDVMVEAFKADQFDFRMENSAKNWATKYDESRFPARAKGYVKLMRIPDKSSGVMQAFVPNGRRDKFKDWRVRRALNYTFDFETTNRVVFFGQYFRPASFFAGSELASSGLPDDKQLEILEKYRGKIPDSVFTEEYTNPVAGDDVKLRQNLREAVRLFREAGYELRGRRMVNAETGEPFTFELLDFNPDGGRMELPWKGNLAKIGIRMNYRVVETSTYINRLRSFDFDMITAVWGQSLSPGNEQRNYWGSESKDRQGSRNYAGIADPAVDGLIDDVIFAPDRETLVAAVKAMDRVLLHHHFVIPQLYYPFDRIAVWDRFGHPDPLPEYSVGFPTVWWWDEEKAARIK